jgi:hypothetical protein
MDDGVFEWMFECLDICWYVWMNVDVFGWMLECLDGCLDECLGVWTDVWAFG